MFETSGETPSSSRFEVFSFFFALQALGSICLSWPDPVHLSLLVPAVLLLSNSGSAPYLLILAVAQAATILWALPQVPNHSIMVLALDLLLIFSWIRLRLLGRWSREAWLDSIGPASRAILLIVYFFAAFHKLNSDYFDVASSCTSFVYQVTLEELKLPWFPKPDGVFGTFLVFLVVLVELAIPVPLLLRSTRLIGLGVGVLFHIVLGVTHYNFSLAVFAFYVFFLPKSFFNRVLPDWARGHVAVSRFGRWAVPCLVLFSVYLFFLGTQASGPGVWRSPWWERSAHAWVFLSAALLGFLIYLLHWGRASLHQSEEDAFRGGWRFAWIFPLLVFVNGLSPYLGWKTGNSFNMFSNLITEGGRSNHLLIPKGLFQLWDYQDDLVVVTGANHPAFHQMVLHGTPIPLAEVQRRVDLLSSNGERGIRLAYVRGGKTFESENAEQDPQLSGRLPWYRRKFSIFKENLHLVPSQHRKCSW